MDLRIIHHNHNVANLETSIAFYEKALGLHESAARPPRTAPISSSIWGPGRTISRLN